jgi:polysaccharide pyruvyl transferase WcaK-like protein
VLQNAAWVNLRDTYTVDFYNVPEATVSECPTVAYLDDSWTKDVKESQNLLLSTHTGLVDSHDRNIIERETRSAAKDLNLNFTHTDNIQTRTFGLHDIIKNCYQRSALVVTTRLHGAIIAYSLGVPYVAIARDEKVRAFCQEYGNGICVEDTDEIKNAIHTHGAIQLSNVARNDVIEFGQEVKDWITSQFPHDSADS